MTVRCGALSDFDCLRIIRLPNWGFVGRHDTCKPDPEAISGGIYDMGRFKDSADDEAPGGPPPDVEDADRLEAFIRQMPEAHKAVIVKVYYRREPSRADDIYAAIRALMDTMEANRATVRRMRELSW